MIGIHITNGRRILPAFVGTLSDADRSVDWTQAACRDEDPELFFPEKGGSYSEARDICETCPIRARCLEYAMQREGSRKAGSRWGLWGGLDPWERANLARRRSRR